MYRIWAALIVCSACSTTQRESRDEPTAPGGSAGAAGVGHMPEPTAAETTIAAAGTLPVGAFEPTAAPQPAMSETLPAGGYGGVEAETLPDTASLAPRPSRPVVGGFGGSAGSAQAGAGGLSGAQPAGTSGTTGMASGGGYGGANDDFAATAGNSGISSADLCADIECPATQGCVNGVCICPDFAPDMCLLGSAWECVNLQNNELHCGECRNECAVGISCVAGICDYSNVDPCPSDYICAQPTEYRISLGPLPPSGCDDGLTCIFDDCSGLAGDGIYSEIPLSSSSLPVDTLHHCYYIISGITREMGIVAALNAQLLINGYPRVASSYEETACGSWYPLTDFPAEYGLCICVDAGDSVTITTAPC